MVTKFKKYHPPFFLSKVSAGFPSPADDFIEKPIDLNEVLILHASATQLITMHDDSLLVIGIFANDYLLLDTAIKPKHGKIVACNHHGEIIIGRWNTHKNEVNNQTLTNESLIIGVITWAIRRL